MGGGEVNGVGVASQVALVVKKPPTRAGDGRGDGSDPWVRGHGNPPQCSAWRLPGREEPGGPQFTGSQRDTTKVT